MSIPVEMEDVAELKKWGMGLESLIENCQFCSVQTRYWHKATNTPVCQTCSVIKTLRELKATQ